MAHTPDALLTLRRAIALNRSPITTLDPSDPSTPAPPEHDLTKATHLQFSHAGHLSLPLNTPTRFENAEGPVDLRTVYFAWLKRDAITTEYLAAARELHNALQAEGKVEGQMRNLLFAEKVDLQTWLEGAAEESSYIKPMDEETAAAQAAADNAASVAAGATGGIAQVSGASTGVGGNRSIDPRLREIYNEERRMGDRNSILRGIKPTDFSHIRKYAEGFLVKDRGRNPPKPASSTLVQMRGKPAMGGGSSGSNRHREPIILLSPSASSLLRMTNIKSFLGDGIYAPADSASAAPNILHISRLLPSIDQQRPLRFILVDSADQFKPDYWNRVVAVFTTGQLWQFKSYLWQSPPDLFSHALGLYVGWKGEIVPETVKGWGRGVMTTQVDKFNPNLGANARWRDREVVEGIWSAIEESMRSKSWGKEAA